MFLNLPLWKLHFFCLVPSADQQNLSFFGISWSKTRESLPLIGCVGLFQSITVPPFIFSAPKQCRHAALFRFATQAE